ncbi:MAG TPA: hypothetical protein VE569_08345 [Acidimicrobiia bacterium]|nr:hypothetical protein [Acidimicrobiia bacterium]
MRRLLAVCLLALVTQACGSGTDTTLSTTAGATDPQGTTRTTVDTSQSTTTSDTTEDTTPRPLAPDFTLELGEGASFTLSEGTKPVYLVFWAEW